MLPDGLSIFLTMIENEEIVIHSFRTNRFFRANAMRIGNSYLDSVGSKTLIGAKRYIECVILGTF